MALEVQYNVILPFLAHFNDIKATTEKIEEELVLSKPIVTDGGEVFLNYRDNYYHKSRNSIDKFLMGYIKGRKIKKFRKGRVIFPLEHELVSLIISTPCQYDTKYFTDSKGSVYTAKKNNNRWVLENRRTGDYTILKADLKRDDSINLYHIGAKVLEKISGNEICMGKVEASSFFGHRIENCFGKIDQRYENKLLAMMNALLTIDRLERVSHPNYSPLIAQV
jgi:hypothetical protein